VNDDDSKTTSKLPGDPVYDAHVPINKIDALIAAAREFANSPADGGLGHLVVTVEMLSEQVRELRTALYGGPTSGP